MKTFLLVFALSFLVSSLQAQPQLPILSLGVRNNGAPYAPGNTRDWYPDSRIWTVPSRTAENATELLVPVFITNNWETPAGEENFKIKEISSFSFRIYYDDRALEFLDVQQHHKYSEQEARNLRISRFSDLRGNYREPLSKHFNISAADKKATDYMKYFDRHDAAYDGIGRTVTITGTASSFNSLPITDANERLVLVYLRFKVVNYVSNTFSQNSSSKLYFDPAYICYNGINIAKDQPIKLFADYPGIEDVNYQNFLTYFTSVRPFTRADNFNHLDRSWNLTVQLNYINSMVGLQRYTNIMDPNKFTGDPYLPGTIDVIVATSYPEFNFEVDNPASTLPVAAQIVRNATNSSIWELRDPITADSLFQQPLAYNNKSIRLIDVDAVSNAPQFTMKDIVIETDQNWLKVFTVMPDNDYYRPFTDSLRRAFVHDIDHTVYLDYNPFPSAQPVQFPKQLKLALMCDPTGLLPGNYVGYVTFKSPFDRFEPTKILVKFTVIDNPLERNENATTHNSTVPVPYGISLKLTPINGTATTLSKTLILGTGSRASDMIDTLYGETPALQRLGINRMGVEERFDARLFLDSNIYTRANCKAEDLAHWQLLTTNGFSDYTHLDGYDNKLTRSNSRDIRSSNASDKSHIYYVKFNYSDNNTDYFPVVLEWSTDHFLAANTVFLRYMMNGIQHVIDMRTEGTPIGNNRYTFTFTDKSVSEFWIEYTVGQDAVTDLVDNFGDPIIMPNGWNLVSLPLNPVNKYYKYVYRNLVGNMEPLRFVQNGWESVEDLQPGVGYYVKYGNTIDKQFTGANFYRVNKDINPVRVYPYANGWNAIGALSTRVPSTAIRFDAFETSQPSADFTANHAVWAYRTNKGFAEVNMLYPGKGYWIKVDADGYLNMEATLGKQTIDVPPVLTNKVAGFDRITVADVAQNSANVYVANNVDLEKYQLPPVPPEGMFDVRFSKGTYASNYDESLVEMNGVTYPVSVSFENPKASYTVVDPQTGFVYGTVKAGSSQNIVINDSRSNVFKLVPEATDESFFVTVAKNPVTTNVAELTFGINQDANTVLSIFNSIGDEVVRAELGDIAKGIHNRNLDVKNLSSGSYTVRLLAGSESKIFRLNIVK